MEKLVQCNRVIVKKCNCYHGSPHKKESTCLGDCAWKGVKCKCVPKAKKTNDHTPDQLTEQRDGIERLKKCRNNAPNICGCYARPVNPAPFICFDCPSFVPNNTPCVKPGIVDE